MAAYKEPTFQERTALAQQAREKALAKLAAKPALDPAEVARRQEASRAREQAAAEKSAAKKAAIAQAKADKIEAAKVPPPPAGPTEAELKAARDERYAARKKRKR
jgi:hypothetical protein